MKNYWKDIDAKNGKAVRLPDDRAPEDNSIFSLFDGLNEKASSSRRDFLKLCGFSFAVAGLASCQTKIRKAVPYAVAPLEITPGEANYYASTFMEGSDYCSIIVKTREGRPIKIEGNPASGISQGGTSARVQASVLELYDTSRYQGPLKAGADTDWAVVDAEIMSKLAGISGSSGSIVLLTPTIYSPSTESVIAGFIEAYPGTEWIQYDAVSRSGMLEANKISFGMKAIPDYRFDKSDLVVSIGADFLGSWISPVEYTKQFSSRRNPDGEMIQLIQFESNLSLTGSNADRRIQIRPSDEAAILLNLYKEILQVLEGRSIDVPSVSVDISGISGQLLGAKGKSLVISGSNDREIQLLVNEINTLLGNIGESVLLDSHLRTYGGIDSEMSGLVSRMKSGEVDALLVYDVNPVYTWFDSEGFVSGLEKVGMTVSLGHSPDETSELADLVCPSNHYLESWNDAEPRKNKFSLMQPAMSQIFDTRQIQDTLLKWSGVETEEGFYEYLYLYWTGNLMSLQTEHSNPQTFFDHTLQAGIFEPSVSSAIAEEDLAATPGKDTESSNYDPSALISSPSTNRSGIDIVMYESISLGTGRQANNPWLQELPDPISKICWDNYISVSPKQAREMGLETGDVVQLEGVEVPV
ncbi:MAG TPA: molybdopterin oxidoreductase, partial [Bacteroides sp.]|nr:molybdopterin oxidoreductase [Bacteroides sp.]